MATINTNYGEQEEGFAGMTADSGYDDVVTLIQGETTAEIPFGAMIALGTPSTVLGTPDKGILPVDGTSKFVGPLQHTNEYAKPYELGDVGVKPANVIGAKNKGRMMVLAEAGTYVRGAQLYVRHTANGAGKLQKGSFRPDADTANAALCKGVTVHKAKTLASIGYVEVEVNMDSYRAQ